MVTSVRWLPTGYGLSRGLLKDYRYLLVDGIFSHTILLDLLQVRTSNSAKGALPWQNISNHCFQEIQTICFANVKLYYD